MTGKKLHKLKRELNALRRGAVKAAQVEGLARKLGRKPVKRGKEPVWESQYFDDLYPLAIPHHGGRDLAPGTKNSILDQLENDVLAWEETLNEDDNDNEEDDED